eukprot:gene4657-5100_t
MALVDIDSPTLSSVMNSSAASMDNDIKVGHSSVATATNFDCKKLVMYSKSLPTPIKQQSILLDAATHIGLRPSQEDRFVLIPQFFSPNVTFAGVFDGTVGPHAADFIAKEIPYHLAASKHMQELLRSTNNNLDGKHQPPALEAVACQIKAALHETFLSADRSLLAMCAEQNLHYASSTGVTALLWNNLLTVAHIGDSKACIMKVMPDGRTMAEWLTIDHKPNMPHELERIERSGGSLVWLHGNKPYIRGADFVRRQCNGEHPKQLNYSRAFGGKDLKKYGLIAEPDINHFEILPDDRLVLLASDGLWDVLSPNVAFEVAFTARREGRCPCHAIVECAIREMPNRNVQDNCTVIAIFLNESR